MPEKLAIYKCSVSGGEVSRIEQHLFKAMINPESFTYRHGISYEEPKAQGALPSVGDFSKYAPEEVDFSLLLDGTGFMASVKRDPKSGAAQSVSAEPVLSVEKRIKQLKSVVFTFDGSVHRPNIVCLVWGNFTLYCCLTKIEIQYTLFNQQGEPLRAKVDLAFKGYLTKREESLRANKSSPDLTHIVEVKAGDTLPLLCQRIYQDGSYCPEVARANNLTSFRYLKPGTKLIFPPLR
jgi:hypothetical protein